MEQFSVDQGLPHTDVFATVQDGDGFIWIGTSKGLARFSESGGLRVVDDGIFATSHLALDDGRLLLTSYNGIFTYNPDNDGFEKIGPYESRRFAAAARGNLCRDDEERSPALQCRAGGSEHIFTVQFRLQQRCLRSALRSFVRALDRDYRQGVLQKQCLQPGISPLSVAVRRSAAGGHNGFGQPSSPVGVVQGWRRGGVGGRDTFISEQILPVYVRFDAGLGDLGGSGWRCLAWLMGSWCGHHSGDGCGSCMLGRKVSTRQALRTSGADQHLPFRVGQVLVRVDDHGQRGVPLTDRIPSRAC